MGTQDHSQEKNLIFSTVIPQSGMPASANGKNYFKFNELILQNNEQYVSIKGMKRAEIMSKESDLDFIKNKLMPYMVRAILTEKDDMSDVVGCLVSLARAIQGSPGILSDAKHALQLKVIIDNFNISKIKNSIMLKTAKKYLSTLEKEIEKINLPAISQSFETFESVKKANDNLDDLNKWGDDNDKIWATSSASLLGWRMSEDLSTNIISNIHNRVIFREKGAEKGLRVNGTSTGFEYISFDAQQSCNINSDPHAYASLYTQFQSVQNSYFILREFKRLDEVALDQYMSKIVLEYHSNLKNAHSTKEKLDCIIQLVSELTKLHPFKNGNMRTFTFNVLNRELIKNGFRPSLLTEPMLFKSMVDKNVLVEAVSEGIERFEQSKKASVRPQIM